MRHGRRALLFATAILLGALPCGPAAADHPLAGPHAFDDGLQLVRGLLDQGKCAQGITDLNALLEAHARKDYVKARRFEIEELMMHLVCGTKFPRPKPQDLLSGKLEKWAPDTGKIKITYTPATAKDLEARDKMLYLPAHIEGPATLEIKGSSYPAKARELPKVVFGGDLDPESARHQSWEFRFGASEKKRRGSAKAQVKTVHLDGAEENTLSTKSASTGKAGKPYKLVVKITKTKVAVTLQGRTVGSAKKPKTLYGYLGFRAGGWTQAKLTGTVDPAWIEERVREILRTQLFEFEKSYVASKHVPKWLKHRRSRESSRPKRPEVDLLADLGRDHYDATLDVENEIRAEEYEKALAGIDKMQAMGVPEATCEYLRAKTYQQMSELEKAVAHMEKCLTLEPEFLDGILMQGTLLRELGKFEASLQAFERAMQGHAQFPHAYEEASSSMMSAGRPDDAKRITQLAARNGVTSDKLIELNSALAKVVNGPRWRKRFEHKSANYHVMSDIDQVTCREAATSLDVAFDAFRREMGFVPRDKTRLFKVYLFSDKRGFMAYQGNLSEFMGKPTEWAAGLYSPILKQLLIWDHANRAEMMNTVRHEGFHQYLDRLMPAPPVWFNEGLACYFENPAQENGKLTFGQMHPNFIRVLGYRPLEPLKKFLFLSPYKFYESKHRSYGQAWLFVHMLQHTSPQNLALFKGMVKDLRTKTGYTVCRAAFTPEVLARLDRELEAYLKKLGG